MQLDMDSTAPESLPGGTEAMAAPDLGARLVRWVPMAATILATTTAVLLASGLAVVMGLS